MSQNDHARLEKRATYFTLIGLFLGLLGAFTEREDRTGRGLRLRPFDFVLLGFAVVRTGRLAAYDKVTEPLRAAVTETVPDSSGAGMTTAAQGTGPRRALGELLACPTCVGTWAAAFLVYGLRLAPRPTRAYLAIMGGTGLAEVLDAAIEGMKWTGRAERRESAPPRGG